MTATILRPHSANPPPAAGPTALPALSTPRLRSSRVSCDTRPTFAQGLKLPPLQTCILQDLIIQTSTASSSSIRSSGISAAATGKRPSSIFLSCRCRTHAASRAPPDTILPRGSYGCATANAIACALSQFGAGLATARAVLSCCAFICSSSSVRIAAHTLSFLSSLTPFPAKHPKTAPLSPLPAILWKIPPR